MNNGCLLWWMIFYDSSHPVIAFFHGIFQGRPGNFHSKNQNLSFDGKAAFINNIKVGKMWQLYLLLCTYIKEGKGRS